MPDSPPPQFPDIAPTALANGRIGYAVIAGELGITVFSDFEWTDAIAQEFMDECLTLTKSKSKLGGRSGLSYLAGRGPGASQRGIIAASLQRYEVSRSLRSVIVSNSALVRGAATALGWLTRNETRVFPADQVEAAALCAAFEDPALAARVVTFTRACMALAGVP